MRTKWFLMVLACLTVALCLVADRAAKAGDPAIPADQLEKVKAALPDKAYVEPAQPRKILVFTLTKGFRHSSIPIAAKTLELMGKKTGAFSTVTTDDISMLKAENLAKFDAFCSDQNTGNLTDDAQIKKDIVDYVKGGKGWIGIHAATDIGGWNAPAYHEMIGGIFAGHPFGHISVKLDDPASSINQMFDGKGFEITDEIYTFHEPYTREKLHVLLSIDWKNAHINQGANRKDNDYALSWIRDYGKGRVFYCAFGHQEPIWWNAPILKHYLAGIQYAVGDLKADATPSAKVDLKAAPGPDLSKKK